MSGKRSYDESYESYEFKERHDELNIDISFISPNEPTKPIIVIPVCHRKSPILTEE